MLEILEMAHEPNLEKRNTTTQKQNLLMPELQERTPGKMNGCEKR